MNPLSYTYHHTPIGKLLLLSHADALTGLHFVDGKHVPAFSEQWLADDKPFHNVRRQLDDYFAGKRRSFDVPLAPVGTEFQRRVWQALQTIPYGETWTYTQLAAQLGQPSAVRAVAAANGRNRVSILIPCHRVIGSNGTLPGYAGGLNCKAALLKLEGALVA